MADNTTLPTGAGGDTIRTIDRTTSKTQVIALDVGGELGPEALVSNSVIGQQLPVSDPGTQEIIHLLQSLLAQTKAVHLTLSHMAGITIDPATLLDDDVIN